MRAICRSCVSQWGLRHSMTLLPLRANPLWNRRFSARTELYPPRPKETDRGKGEHPPKTSSTGLKSSDAAPSPGEIPDEVPQFDEHEIVAEHYFSSHPPPPSKSRDKPPHLADAAPGTVRISGIEMDVVKSFKLSGKKLRISKIEPIRQAKVAKLARGLDRVLFNPSVYILRDPHSLVYNFPPSLEVIPRPEEFAFERLPHYVTASKDPELLELAEKNDCKFYGSTSTLTTALSQIYFLISGNRPVDTSQLSTAFANERTSFTVGAMLPAKLFLRVQPDGRYAIDNDKSHEAEEGTILSDLGRIMEKLLTSEEKDMKRFLKSSPDSGVSEAERNEREAYYYSKGTTLLMRSQLDCHDKRLPGTGTFDIKTRAAITIRQDRTNHLESSAYDIASSAGLYESFERELYDMSRSAFLKYSLQVRIGNMDGIFVAYHNSKRILGFQYIPLPEMNRILHGTDQMGEQAFKLSVSVLEHILQEATDCFPGKTVSFLLEYQEKSDALVAYVRPGDETVRVDDVEGIPTIAVTVRNVGRLNKKGIYGNGVNFESRGSKLDSIDWSLEVDLIKSPMTQEGVDFAKQGRDAACQRHVNMQTLYAPAGKTAKEMTEAAQEAEAATRQPGKQDGGEISAESQKDKQSDEAIVRPSAARIVWRDAGGTITRLRKLSAESGKRYDERIKRAKGKKVVMWSPATSRG